MKRLVRAALALSGLIACAAAAQSPWPQGVTRDMRDRGDVKVQVSGLVGGDSITVTGSLDCSANGAPLGWFDASFGTGTAITAPGLYSFAGGVCVTWTQTGSASSPTLVLRGRE